jgi:hypothetical protein
VRGGGDRGAEWQDSSSSVSRPLSLAESPGMSTETETSGRLRSQAQ